MRGLHLLMGTVLAFMVSTVANADTGLTFEQRVEAQAAIDRVYHRHQRGEKRSFEQAVPRAVLEKKVRRYLEQSMALERVWKAPITAEMLERELERMADETRMPARLSELFAALGDDPMLVQECLVRPLLAERLSRERFAFDANVHAAAREEAERLRHALTLGELDPRAEHPRRRVVTSEEAPSVEDSAVASAAGGVSVVLEEADRFVVEIVLDGSPGERSAARYTVGKRTWDAWWSDLELDAVEVEPLPAPRALPEPRGTACEDAWTEVWPGPSGGSARVWTGSVMLVYDGNSSPTSKLTSYDPVTNEWTQSSAPGAPSGRLEPTFVWAGDRVLVWGGHHGCIPFGSGQHCDYADDAGAYDPLLDTWTPLATAGQPTGRRGQAAVWTGSELIIWGGIWEINGGASYLGGRRYDPVANVWLPVSSQGQPTPRMNASAVWTGQKLLVWGGIAGSVQNTGGAYDPGTDTWTPISTVNAPQARHEHSAVFTGQEMIVWGGHPGSSSSHHLATGGRYDVASDTWAPVSTAGAPSARSLPSLLWTGEQVLLWGGKLATAGAPPGRRYDPVTDTWSDLASLSYTVAGAALWTGDRMLVMDLTRGLGGLYDPQADTWSERKPVSDGRVGHGAVWTGSQAILWGGYQTASTTYLQSGYRYDPATATWTETSQVGAPAGRRDAGVGWTGSEMLVWGGFDGGYHGDGGRYDPLSDTWTAMSATGAPSPRTDHTATWTGEELVVWGGTDGSALSTGARYDPETDTWNGTTTVGAPASRSLHSAVWTRNEVLVWGGRAFAGSSFFDSGGRYAPSSDTWAPMTPNPFSGSGGHSAFWTGDLMLVKGPGARARYSPATDSWSEISNLSGSGTGPATWTGGELLAWTNSSGSAYSVISDRWTPLERDGAPLMSYTHSATWMPEANSMLVWGGSTPNAGVYFRHLDADGDGVSACEQDCNDTEPAAYPGATERCDGIDNDCDGGVDEGFQTELDMHDDDGDGWNECELDCDDADPTAHPGATEVCDQIDNDCNGVEDDPYPTPGRVTGLTFYSTTAIQWDVEPVADRYDQIRGWLDVLRSNGGNFAVTVDACLTNQSATGWHDPTTPASGAGYYYLIRAKRNCRLGSYTGGGSGEQPGRDASLGQVAPCQ